LNGALKLKTNNGAHAIMKKVTEINIYPIKSMGGIGLSQAQVLPKGLQYDRRWMLMDENNQFITQRKHAQLALFQLEMVDAGFMVRYQHSQLLVPFDGYEATAVTAVVWNDSVQVHEVSREHHEWFSDSLHMKCKLVFFPEGYERWVDPVYAKNNEQTSLSDGYPILVAGAASLHDLNTRLETPVPMNRFRPNIVFDNGDAYEEDTWDQFTINHLSFTGVKPCGRCVVTTINQQTAEKGKEPLATLSQYRNSNGKVLFGQNVWANDSGVIQLGDAIHVQRLH
jgi:uncharacterized protein